MNQQTSLWQEQHQSSDFSELCNALYERELRLLADADISSVQAIQARIKSLPYYIKRTAHLMTQANTPLALDTQNASWSAKQSAHIPLAGQEHQAVWQWLNNTNLVPGLVLPIALSDRIVLDCVDKVDQAGQRFRTNLFGWCSQTQDINEHAPRILKPNKKVMSAACAGHCWRDNQKVRPNIPTLRELLLSCQINWKNFKQPLSI
ncbi:hypothetical protein [Thalassotalea sp. PLHSN55]|uniref:hypothetical protein n=1 Tax=Thalassotalea sp. PLHSN55 TaxID=3435888 RepID=UPI003F83366F